MFLVRQAGECYQAMRRVCLNASDITLDFCDECRKCGMLDFLIKELEYLKRVYKENILVKFLY